jgi:hypothetical protein
VRQLLLYLHDDLRAQTEFDFVPDSVE